MMMISARNWMREGICSQNLTLKMVLQTRIITLAWILNEVEKVSVRSSECVLCRELGEGLGL